VGLASLLENKLEIAAEIFSQNLLLDLVQHRCFEFFFVEQRGIASQPPFLQVRRGRNSRCIVLTRPTFQYNGGYNDHRLNRFEQSLVNSVSGEKLSSVRSGAFAL
jgi:hypothetical protein